MRALDSNDELTPLGKILAKLPQGTQISSTNKTDRHDITEYC
jgi:hypothetical protein